MLDSFLKSRKQGVYYIGHASALARVHGKLFLFDPIWDEKPYGDHWIFAPAQINCDSVLGLVDACFVSHIHADHLSEKILSKLHCPIFIMGGRPKLTERLKKITQNVTEVDPLEWKYFVPGIRMLFVPHAFNGVDSSVVVSSHNFTVYHGNDNFLDSRLITAVKTMVPHVDVAMVPYAFVHWYPGLMCISDEERQKETKRLKEQSLHQAQLFRSEIRPKLTIPFGNSLYYAGGPNHVLNESLATPHEFEGATPMFAGDFYIDGEGVSYDDEGFRPMKKILRDALKDTKDEPLDTDFPCTQADVEAISKRVKRATFTVRDHRIIVNDLVIDLERLEASIPHVSVQPYTRFFFDFPIYHKWVLGELTFEQAIGTRRFRCLRRPNEYNQRIFEFMNQFL